MALLGILALMGTGRASETVIKFELVLAVDITAMYRLSAIRWGR